jgi:hypothetical protein
MARSFADNGVGEAAIRCRPGNFLQKAQMPGHTESQMTTESKPPRPHSWDDWYRFAHEELELAHTESVEYANHRDVEERNRENGPEPAKDRRYA